MNCIDDRVDTPSFDVLRVVFSKANIEMYEINSDNVVTHMSPFATQRKGSLVGTIIDVGEHMQVIPHGDSRIIIVH